MFERLEQRHSLSEIVNDHASDEDSSLLLPLHLSYYESLMTKALQLTVEYGSKNGAITVQPIP